MPFTSRGGLGQFILRQRPFSVEKPEIFRYNKKLNDHTGRTAGKRRHVQKKRTSLREEEIFRTGQRRMDVGIFRAFPISV